MSGKLLPPPKSGPLHQQKAEAARLGRRALLTGIGTILGASLLTFGIGGWFFGGLGLIGGIIGLGFTAQQVKEWLEYRGKWGLRF